jgi:hypothetical protein
VEDIEPTRRDCSGGLVLTPILPQGALGGIGGHHELGGGEGLGWTFFVRNFAMGRSRRG